MTGRRADIVAFDDQVAATIRDLGQGTTGAVVTALAGTTITRLSKTRCRCRCGAVEHMQDRPYTLRATSDHVRPALRRLARRGLVVEVKTPQGNNYGGYLWLWIG